MVYAHQNTLLLSWPFIQRQSSKHKRKQGLRGLARSGGYEEGGDHRGSMKQTEEKREKRMDTEKKFSKQNSTYEYQSFMRMRGKGERQRPINLRADPG